jgi:hypothetical protein
MRLITQFRTTLKNRSESTIPGVYYGKDIALSIL